MTLNIPQMQSQPMIRTAYDIRYENTMSPFMRAKYGIGVGPASSLQQLQQPRVATQTAGMGPTQLSSFSPSGSGMQPPRLQPMQFGNNQ